MAQKHFVFGVGSILFLLLAQHAIAKKVGEVNDERPFEYKKGTETGPEKWGELKKEWKACKNGKIQSPIDIKNERVKLIPTKKDLFVGYKPAPASIINRGHDISIQWTLGQAGSIKINSTRYYLQQCHWHSPSEHTVNGKKFDMELHMVHTRKDRFGKDRIAVVGVLYNIGAPDSFLTTLLRNISALPRGKEPVNVGVVDPKLINMGSFYYYRYLGSLTIPPCTEGVIWTINKKPRTVSVEQIKLLRDAVHDHAKRNARPVQPHNKRPIHSYGY